MTNPKYHIVSDNQTKTLLPQRENLCIFCHFDRGNIIEEYVIHYIKSLFKAGCEVLFITNSTNIEKTELGKIEGFVSRIIVRNNVGRDFGCYFTGYELYKESLNKYKNLLFINDSVYGPFYELKQVFEKMANKYDIWGIADTFYPEFFLESYFLNFSINNNVLNFLDNFFKNYDFTDNKDEIVEKYEFALSRKAIASGLHLGSFCNHLEVIGFEMMNENEPVIHSIKKLIYEAQSYKINFKKYFSNQNGRYHKLFREKAAYVSLPKYSCWYTMIKYFNMPFIKICLLNNIRNIIYKNFMYRQVINQSHPEYNVDLIDRHLRRLANFDIKNVKK